jgi:hypothetical protein
MPLRGSLPRRKVAPLPQKARIGPPMPIQANFMLCSTAGPRGKLVSPIVAHNLLNRTGFREQETQLVGAEQLVGHQGDGDR